MGKKKKGGGGGEIVPLQVDAEGTLRFDALARIGQRKDKVCTYKCVVMSSQHPSTLMHISTFYFNVCMYMYIPICSVVGHSCCAVQCELFAYNVRGTFVYFHTNIIILHPPYMYVCPYILF